MAALVSISGLLFLVAAVWHLAAVIAGVRRAARAGTPERHTSGERSLALAIGLHGLVAVVTTLGGLVAHILGYYPVAFALVYAGGISMLAATVSALLWGQRVRKNAMLEAVLLAISLVVLTIGLLGGS